MQRFIGIPIRMLAVFAILSLFTSGCSLLEDILNAIARRCADSTFTVTTTVDSNTGVCTVSGCSLRNAVSLANICPGRQSILVPAGTYVLSIAGANEDRNKTGDLDITDSVDLVGEGSPIIDGNHTDRVLDIMAGTTVDLTGLTITNGRTVSDSASDYSGYGGGILNRGILHIHSSTITRNEANAGGTWGFGGGIFSDSPEMTIDNGSQVTWNSAPTGGGIAVLPPLGGTDTPSFELADSTVADNSAEADGGLALNAHASLTRFIVRDNHAGGANAGGLSSMLDIFLNSGTIEGNTGGTIGGLDGYGTLDVRQVLIQNNSGGVYLSPEAQATFLSSAIINNTLAAPEGVGIENHGRLTVENTTISENWRAIFFSDPAATLVASFTTIADNINVGLDTTGSGTVINNSILAGNGRENCSGTPISGGFNVSSDASCSLRGPGDLNGTDARLNPLTAAGDTFVHTFDTALPSSALDSADPSACPPNPPTDQLGTDRPQNLHCDRGAWEAPPVSASAPLVAASPTPAPTETLTAIPAVGLSFIQPDLSVDHFYSGGAGCGPLDLKLQVGVSQPNQISSVVLFFHLKDKTGSGSTNWNEGVAMEPLGSGRYSYDLASKTIPAFNSYPEAWLVYQFAATGAGGQVVLRSPAYSNVTLPMCGKK